MKREQASDQVSSGAMLAVEGADGALMELLPRADGAGKVGETTLEVVTE